MKAFRISLLAIAAVAGLSTLPTGVAAPPESPSATVDLQPLGPFGNLPADAAPPTKIAAVAILADGSVALLDGDTRRILLLDNNGGWRGEAGGFGFGRGALRSAGDLAAVGFELWACDPMADQIVRYDPWLAPLEPFTSVTDGNSKLALERPISAARSVQGDLIVLEADRADGLLTDPQGRLVERVASFGQAGPALVEPRRIETTDDNGFAIADPGLHAVVLLDRFGTLRGLRPWKLAGDGPVGIAQGNHRLWLCGDSGIVAFSDTGSELGRWPREIVGGPVQDIALRGDRLYAAVGKSLLQFRIIVRDGR